MYCWKCGAEIQEGRDRCIVCYARAHRYGLLSRLFNWFKRMAVAMPHVSVSIQIPTTVQHQALQKGPVEIGFSKENFSVQKNQILLEEEIPPDIRAKIQAGEEVTIPLDKLPPEVRARLGSFPNMLRFPATDRKQPLNNQVFTIRTASGQEQTYRSLEEMPPDIRSQVETIQTSLSPGESKKTYTSQTYTFRDTNGPEQTYHSIEEMPPHVRAIFEKMRPEEQK